MQENTSNSIAKYLLASLLLAYLVMPGLRPIFKYLPAPILIASLYALLFSLWIFARPLERYSTLGKIISHPLFSVALLVLVGVICWFTYPIADALKLSMRGSDQDDCIILGANALLQLAHPYLQKTYFDNPCSPGPGLLILYIPFVWMHLYILGSIVAMSVVAWLLYRHWASWALVGAWLITLLFSLVMPDALVVGSDLILPACVILAIALLLAPTLASQNYFSLFVLAIAAGLVSSMRINFIVFAPLIALFIFTRWKLGSIVFLICSLVVALAPGLLIYQIDPAQFTPLHLLGKSSKFISPEILLLGGLGSISIALYCAYGLAKKSIDFPLAMFFSLAPMLLMASIGELAYGQWDIASWAGANYLIPLIPLAAYLLIDNTKRDNTKSTLIQNPNRYQGAHG
jgi:hypothetical protein